MLKPLLRSSYLTVALVVALAGLDRPCRAASADAAPAAAQPNAEPAAPHNAAGGTGTAGNTPGSTVQSAPGTPAATADVAAEATKRASTCKNAIAELASKPAALAALPKDHRDRLASAPAAGTSITCLAIANGNRGYCDALPDEAKKKCLAQFEQVRELKDLPKEQLKARVIRDLCMHGQLCDDCGKPECDKIEAAVNTGDAAKCAGLSQAMQAFCAALAARDAAKCKGVPGGEGRSTCEAFATEDAKRCAPNSADCRNVTNGFAAFRKQGLAGLQGIDPGVAAAAQGTAVCQPLLAKFEKVCIEEK